MKSAKQNPFLLTAVGAALLLAFRPALAQDDEITQLTKPQSSIDVGVGYVDKDNDENQRFGQYTGLTDKGAYGIVDFSLLKRDDSTGTWFSIHGRNLGYDDRELRLEQRRQGNWGYFIDYSRIPRYDPFTVNTGLQGLGTTTQTTVAITPGTGSDYHLKTTRDRWTVGFQKAFASRWNVQVQYRNEEKDGSRLFGQGTFGGNWRFLADVIDQTTQQVDAVVNYNGERLQLSGGYYGTSFDNHNNKIDTPGAGAPFTEAALPPGNQSHQIYLAGGYNFTRMMRGTFKVAMGRITQNEAWPTTPAAGITRSGLDGRVDTTLMQAGLSGRATPKLSWRADLRYEKRDDKTPIDVYWPSQNTPGSTNNGTNEPRDIETTSGKAVAHYSLPMGFRLTGDVGYVRKKRNHPPVMSVNFRERTDESTYRVEVRRAVSQSVTGAVSYLHSKRDGSEWLHLFENDGVTDGSQLIAPLHLADRTRDTARLVVNWMPTEPLSLNFRADESRDDYTGRGLTPYDLGPRKGRGSNYSVDAAYAFTYRISGTAWYSRNKNEYENATCRDDTANTCTATNPRPVWSANLRNIADSYGLGLRAKLSSKLEFGADLTESKVRDEMDTVAIAPTVSSVVLPLDNINTKITTFKLYGKYALNRHSGIRVDYIFDHYRTDDWTWANWVYGDGTTVLQNPNQKVNFAGISYYYRFH